MAPARATDYYSPESFKPCRDMSGRSLRAVRVRGFMRLENERGTTAALAGDYLVEEPESSFRFIVPKGDFEAHFRFDRP